MGEKLRALLCSSKMAEDSQQRKDDLPQLASERHQPGLKDVSGGHSQQSTPSQLSKEMLYQQRQKCELRRLLKHTHPELKMLDDVVDEEFAEVLSSESVTAGETGYEGEVLSRCLIFENCGLSNNVPPHTPKIHMAKGAVERRELSKTSAVFETSRAEPHTESVRGILEDDKGVDLRQELSRECEDEMIRIDVKATRRIFEDQSRPDHKKFQGTVSMSGDETEVVKAQGKQCEMSYRENPNKRGSTNFEEQGQMPCIIAVSQGTKHGFAGCEKAPGGETLLQQEAESFSDSEKHGDIPKTSAALFKNNPFISANIEKEHSYGHTSKTSNEVGEDYLTANVKNRTHLFESMPFDKIRHQNRDEIETLVENIKETLNFLYHVKVIHSTGSIIEVNETMIAKKAKFILSESGPEIRYDEVAEGGAQNFILQLLPRANLKPQLTYLKENSKKSMEATVVDVPVQQNHFNTNKDSEFRTANVAQLVEDILNQDNSLRKGVIIQEDINNCADVIVYSLYKYFDEKDVKSYSPPQGVEYGKAEPEGGGMRTKSNPNETSQDQTCSLLIGPEMKGNVKLFKTCIEKGDLEYLRTLQAEPVKEPELPGNQTEAGQDKESHHEQKGEATGEVNTECVPVDVKRLKSIFSGDRSHIQESCIQSAKTPHVSHSKSQSSHFSHQQVRESGGQAEEVCNFKAVPYLETEDDNKIHQDEQIHMDKTNEISDFQTATYNLQQTTMEAKSFCPSLQEMHETFTQESSSKPIVSVKAVNATHLGTEAELPQDLDQNVELPTEFKWNKLSSASDIPLGQKTEWQYKSTESCHEDSNSEKVQTANIWSKESQNSTELIQEQHIQTSRVSAHSSDITPAREEDEEVVLQGSVQAAFKSLEKSNINITKGDFKEAMIYRNSNQSHQERPQNVDAISAQKLNTEESCQMTEPESAHRPIGQEVTSKNMGAVSKKSKRQRGPKPAIPPKPKHLMMKQEDKESDQQAQRAHPSINNLSATQINTKRTKETIEVSHPSPETLASCKDEDKQHLFKTNNESVHHQRNQLLGEDVQTLKETKVSLESCQKDRTTITGQQEINAAQEEKTPQNSQGKDNMSETDESPVDFHRACQKFGGNKATAKKTVPVKPKRVKIALSSDNNPLHVPEDNTGGRPVFVNMDPKPEKNIGEPPSSPGGITVNSKNKNEKNMKQESKVEMREKKVQTETEDERRHRLSVHMDEIMRGNITAAMDIFDNLRKQEQLQSILNRVEEIQQETSEVDVRSLRKVFEDVPDWVANSEKKKPKKNRAKNKDKSRPLPTDRTENKSSMAHVYGDLERASEEIMNLKEQTLARLMDIEDAIKKALYSVSTLKSDSDIAGLSCLFKESLGAVQGSSSNGNINKISIGSSRMKPQDVTHVNTATKAARSASTEVPYSKQQPSPPSSPAFISIQSAARKPDKTGALPTETLICPACQQNPKLEEKFRTTKTLTCNSPAQNRKTDSRKGRQKQSTNSPPNANRELSVLEVQTDGEGNSFIGTKTITENYEKTDNFGNRLYSSKTSTVVDAQPETMTTSHDQSINISGHNLSRNSAASHSD